MSLYCVTSSPSPLRTSARFSFFCVGRPVDSDEAAAALGVFAEPEGRIKSAQDLGAAGVMGLLASGAVVESVSAAGAGVGAVVDLGVPDATLLLSLA